MSCLDVQHQDVAIIRRKQQRIVLYAAIGMAVAVMGRTHTRPIQHIHRTPRLGAVGVAGPAVADLAV